MIIDWSELGRSSSPPWACAASRPRTMAATMPASPERLSTTTLGNTMPLVRGSPQRSSPAGAWASAERRPRASARASFGQRLSAVDQRTQRLMVMQKKIQLTEAMEKKLRLDTKNLGPGQRPMTPELMSEIVPREVDRMLSMDSFWDDAGGAPQLAASPSPTKGGRTSSSLFDTDLLRTGGRVSVGSISRSPALALKAQELRSTGKIAGARSQEASAARERRMRASGELQSQSLPDLSSPKQAPAPSKSPKQKSRRRRSRRSSSQRISNPMQEAQKEKLMARAEVLIKRLVRDQMRDLEFAFKLADADGSGSLDELELRNLLYRFNIVMEDDHYTQLMRKIDQDSDGEISYSEFLRYFAKGQAEDTQLTTKITIVDVDEACQMIREKIESRLESGPNGLRRAFRFFDKDMSGAINLKEFGHALKEYRLRPTVPII